MKFQPGTRLGAYEILDLAGAGGMGEVYRARDTRLGRVVAIKVLRGHLAFNPEVRHRFEREARAVSSLNHPHIAALYDVGQADGTDYLVMEHLEGETLADRLARGAIPTVDHLRIGVQIADALDRAHRQGLVHRDLKPGNVMLTKSGAKLLDFGLARTVGVAAGAAEQSSPTMSRPITAEGTIVGTFQYLAPEVLEGKDADTRSDIFSFGAMLYEMATGKRAFEGKSQVSLIASIMKETPRPISTFDALAPPALDRTVLRCLEKDPDDRYQTARDVLLDLRWIAEAGSRAGVAAPVAARRRARERAAWVVAAIATAAAATIGGIAILRPTPEPQPIQFFIAAAPEMRTIGTPKISPDGRFVASNGMDSLGVTRLWLRPLGSLQAHALPGTERAQRPFWSPDSRYLGFMADGKVMKVAITGGPPQTICQVANEGDGAWGSRGFILFDGNPTDSVRFVSAAGGTPGPATRIDRANGENGTAWPQFLPDGRHFLFLGLSAHSNETTLNLGDLESDKRVQLAKGLISRMEYADPGYILFVRDRALLAQPFDLKRLRFSGDPILIVNDIAVGGGGQTNADFSASRNGILAYRGGVGTQSRLTWVDRSGAVLGRVGGPGAYSTIVLSPDGERIALDYDGSNHDIWLIEASRGTKTRFTFHRSYDYWPAWSRDGRSIAFGSDRAGMGSVYVKPVSGAEPESLVFPGAIEAAPGDWSRDGRYLACMQRTPAGLWDIWAVPMTPRERPFPVVASASNDTDPRFSPDGRWLAYSSNESGRWEVYIQPFPGSGGKWQVSSDGGRDPSWRADGRELYFLRTGTLMAVDVTTHPGVQLGTPRALFSGVAAPTSSFGHRYAAASDGKRFLLRAPDASERLPATTVFVNWTSRLRQ